MAKPLELLKVPLKSIVVKPGRGRKEFKHITELSVSIKAQGLINPLCVTEDPDQPGRYILIAGERRFRASCLAGLAEVPVTFREGMSDLEQKIMELEENTHRVDLDWQEEAELHAQIDEYRQLSDPTWNQAKTAQLVGVSRNHVNLQIKMAKKLRDNPELVKEVANLPINAAVKVIEQREQIQRVDRLKSQGKLQITTDLRLGSCVELIKQLPTGSIDMVLCDPPYGLEKLEAMRENAGDRMSGHGLMSEHHNSDFESVIALLKVMAPELVRVVKPGGHIYIFCAAQYLGDFIRALNPLDFQPPVVIWDRQKPTTPGYGYNYLNSTEYVIMFHNPPRTRRLAKSMYNILQHPEVPKNLRVYPTEKPLSLLKDLISQSSILGETVLDFCAGSASTLKAARALGRKSIGFEINPDSWSRAQLILSGQGDNVEQMFLLAEDQPQALMETAKASVRGG